LNFILKPYEETTIFFFLSWNLLVSYGYDVDSRKMIVITKVDTPLFVISCYHSTNDESLNLAQNRNNIFTVLPAKSDVMS